jgi:hypothetical protein
VPGGGVALLQASSAVSVDADGASVNGAEKCPATIIGARDVTGEILCFVDANSTEALTDKEEHELICDPARGESQKGKLFFASSENGATLLAEAEIFLLGIGTDLWSISNEA